MTEPEWFCQSASSFVLFFLALVPHFLFRLEQPASIVVGFGRIRRHARGRLRRRRRLSLVQGRGNVNRRVGRRLEPRRCPLLLKLSSDLRFPRPKSVHVFFRRRLLLSP